MRLNAQFVMGANVIILEKRMQLISQIPALLVLHFAVDNMAFRFVHTICNTMGLANY